MLFISNSISAQVLDCGNPQGPFGEKAIASQVQVQTQVYRTALDYQGKEKRLAMDIYKPVLNLTPNVLRQRPLVVILHGGGVKFGSRQTGLQPILADYLAKRGYVVVCADYRLGWNNAYESPLCGMGQESDYLDAHYRALQDERALVRYLKTQSSSIAFDTSKIFLMGISSGATLALGRLDDRIWREDTDRIARLGNLESEVSPSSKVAGLISIAGANLSDQIMDRFQTPTLFFHGTCDNAVPYREGRLALCSRLGYFFGPGNLNPQLQEAAVCSKLFTFCGFGHDFAAQEDKSGTLGFAVDLILLESLKFMTDVMCETCVAKTEVVNNRTSVTPLSDCSRINEFELCGEVLAPEQTLVELHPEMLGSDRKVFIKSNFDFSREAELMVFNSLGGLLYSKALILLEGVSVEQVVLPIFPKGVYTYQIVSGNRRWRAGKLIIL